MNKNMKNYKIYPNTKIGKNSIIGDFTIIGEPPQGHKVGYLETIIGKNALIRSHSVIYAGTVVGNDFETGHGILVREGNVIGNKVLIGSHTIIENDSSLGDNVKIQSHAFIPRSTTIEDGVWIGPNVVITNDPHPPCGKCIKGPTLKSKAKIGANATILPFLTIGENSLVGAGAVVVDDVPPNTVVIGCPARVIKSIKDLTCQFGILKRPYLNDE
jgi:acetyltransferase-like isoleucine patch superfamily enzyme